MATKRPSRAYSAMFTSLFMGAFFLLAGVTGYNTQHRGVLLADARWTGRPILWEIAVGVALLLVGLYLCRRLGVFRWEVVAGGAPRRMKNVGKGQSSGAKEAARLR
jgi:hypothetical protein